jgi:ABC-type sugar transport system substrate-binding protein
MQRECNHGAVERVDGAGPMTRGALLLGLVAATAVAAGCGGNGAGSAAPVSRAQVAAVIKSVDNPFFATVRDGIVGTARRDGARLRMEAAADSRDTAGQASTLESLVAERAGCYVVNPIDEANLIQPLGHVANGTPIVNIDTAIGKPQAAAVGAEITTYIGTDNVAIGRLGVDAMSVSLGRGARVAVIAGTPGNAASDARVQGFMTAARGRFDIVETVAADFERDNARLAAAALLSERPRIEGIFAVNDLMALGVADAVRAAGSIGAVAVVGVDGIRPALAAVRSGALSATVAQYPYTIGQLAVRACMAAGRGRRVPARIDAPIQVVTSANVARAIANFPRPVAPFPDPLAGSRPATEAPAGADEARDSSSALATSSRSGRS